MRAVLLLVVALSLGFAPAPLPRRERTGAQRPVLVEGTAWSGMDSEGKRYVFRFLPGGNLDYTSPTGRFRNGTWRQSGDAVFMETNQRYWEFNGVVRGDKLLGKAVNVRGGKWTYDLKRDPASYP